MRRTIAAAGIALCLALSAAACGSDDDNDAAPAATTTPTTDAPGDDAVYAEPGPFKVGYTTLHLPNDRGVSVWYPADDAGIGTTPKATYKQTTPLPENLRGLVPPEFDTVVTMEAYDDVRGSAAGPFPVLLFSHGFGAYRQVNSGVNAGIASWGFVVVAVDYTERGLVAQVTNATDPDAARDKRLMLDSLDLVIAEAGKQASVLQGIVDGEHVAAAGHSAGGGTAFNALNDPRVQTAIGWAPVPPSGAPADKPTMIIGAERDNALTPSDLKQTYAGFPAPKRRVEVAGAGHNTFTDICIVIRQGGGLVEFARKNKLVSEQLLALATNGCAKEDLAPAEFFPIVQHFTVAQLRDVFGIDPEPVGLDDPITTAFGDINITYAHQP
jgi:predicted dienelactone hydrolase